MVKEKRREVSLYARLHTSLSVLHTVHLRSKHIIIFLFRSQKKKSKEKHVSRSSKEREEPPILEEKVVNDQNFYFTSIEACSSDALINNEKHGLEFTEDTLSTSNIDMNLKSHTVKKDIGTNVVSSDEIQSKHLEPSEHVIETEIPQEVLTPSAPMLEERPVLAEAVPKQECVEVIKIKTPCIPLEEAIRLFGGEIISEVKAMSEREEAIVEAGPVCGPEHPLVDLLSTFRYVFYVQKTQHQSTH